MAKYRCTTKTFIAPELLDEGTVFTIDDSFEPGPHLEPLDEAANAAVAAYFDKKPHARLNPVEDLPMTTGVAIVEEQAGPAPGSEANPLSLAGAGAMQAEPGPTEAKR